MERNAIQAISLSNVYRFVNPIHLIGEIKDKDTGHLREVKGGKAELSKMELNKKRRVKELDFSTGVLVTHLSMRIR